MSEEHQAYIDRKHQAEMEAYYALYPGDAGRELRGCWEHKFRLMRECNAKSDEIKALRARLSAERGEVERLREALEMVRDEVVEFGKCLNSEDNAISEHHADTYGCGDDVCYAMGANKEAIVEKVNSALGVKSEKMPVGLCGKCGHHLKAHHHGFCDGCFRHDDAKHEFSESTPAAPEPKPCQCGSPILRWVHQQSPRECGKVYDAPAPSPVSEAEKELREIRTLAVELKAAFHLEKYSMSTAANLILGKLIDRLSRLRGESAEEKK